MTHHSYFHYGSPFFTEFFKLGNTINPYPLSPPSKNQIHTVEARMFGVTIGKNGGWGRKMRTRPILFEREKRFERDLREIC